MTPEGADRQGTSIGMRKLSEDKIVEKALER